MRKIQVAASTGYTVCISDGIPGNSAPWLRALAPKAQKLMLVTDDRVAPLYAPAWEAALAPEFSLITHVIPHGEASKCAAQYVALLEALAAARLGREDLLCTLGGGMVGDLGGFAAATYQRGIRFAQLPTTLLAMVDASVGGKTAIDLQAGKNLAGAFHQPVGVLCCCDTLTTLPKEIFIDGCAEVVKYGILGDPALFAHLEEHGLGFDRQDVIARCVAQKRDFVCADEWDRGARRLLNLGHTLGHALEQHSGFALSHGRAVAIGTAVVARAAAKRGLCSEACAERIVRLLDRMGLPTRCKTPLEVLLPLLLADKKWVGAKVELVVPERIGCCRLLPFGQQELLAFLREGVTA